MMLRAALERLSEPEEVNDDGRDHLSELKELKTMKMAASSATTSTVDRTVHGVCLGTLIS